MTTNYNSLVILNYLACISRLLHSFHFHLLLLFTLVGLVTFQQRDTCQIHHHYLHGPLGHLHGVYGRHGCHHEEQYLVCHWNGKLLCRVVTKMYDVLNNIKPVKRINSTVSPS